ncbi:protein kintoun [Genypterus blacodes]|uniref:protein kintoun n=1 Tax=Genypterus blacodes TaxID=154954 RepID=UPI003F771534
MTEDKRGINMTEDELKRLAEAFKDDRFKSMLRDYAAELADPENRKKYEEEIALLEQERGSTIEFIHPQPFKALRTSLNGKQKCYINICTSEKVSKPECSQGVSEDGRRGQRWSLPHNLHPGREDRDAKGNKFMIYDVIFHPDTLHMASKNKRFMDMVDNTAIQGVRDTFKVVLDEKNMTEMKTKYKGTPQPCVIRKPIAGFKAKKPPKEPDPLSFPYPDDKSSTKPAEAPKTKTKTGSKPMIVEIEPEETKEPTKPNYSIKYRSFVDVQDFRLSRDSAQSPRPKEIVVTFDLPLLKSAADTSLEVQGKLLLLESKKPAYTVEVPLAYAVDEDKGEAKFNKQKGQLTVTLPVLPSEEALEFAAGLNQPVCDSERQEEEEEEEELKEQVREGEEKCPQMEGEKGEDEEEVRAVEEEEEKWKEEQESAREEGRVEEDGLDLQLGERPKDGREETDGGAVMEEEDEEKWKEQRQGSEKGHEEKQGRQDEENGDDKERDDGRNGAASGEDSDFLCVQQLHMSAQDQSSVLVDNMCMDSPKIEFQPPSTTADRPSDTAKEQQVKLDSCLESEAQMKPEDAPDESRELEEDVDDSEGHSNQVRNSIITNIDNKVARFSPHTAFQSEEVATGPVNSDVIDEDDLPAEQIFHKASELDTKPPPASLREIDADGKETVISDHSTSSGFTFQNSLMYELD